jgi:hypothetical protein
VSRTWASCPSRPLVDSWKYRTEECRSLLDHHTKCHR